MLDGIVIRSTGSWYEVRRPDGQIHNCRIVGKFRLDGLKSTNPVAVGDKVKFEMTDNDEGIIKKILPRDNYIVRQSPRKKHNVHLIASNVDQALLIVTIVAPKLKQGFIDRFLIMTEPYDIPVMIAFNKSDLYDEDDIALYQYLEAVYTNIGYQTVMCSTMNGEGIDTIESFLKDKKTLISGQSGVGKSSIVNYIEPDIDLRIGDISDYSGKGQHTTTFAEMLPLSMGGDIIDTPGIKTLSFNHLEVEDVTHNFREFFILSENCKFSNCTHRNEPKCAVKQALEEGRVSDMRYNNYLLIINEIEDQNYWERHKDI